MKTVLSWSRENHGKGIAQRHPCNGVCNAITTFAGSGISSPPYGMCNTQPYVIEIYAL